MHAQGGQHMSGQKRECESLGCRHFLDAACIPLWLPHLIWAAGAGAAGWLQLAQMQVPRRPLVQGARCRASHSSVGGGRVGGRKRRAAGAQEWQERACMQVEHAMAWAVHRPGFVGQSE